MCSDGGVISFDTIENLEFSANFSKKPKVYIYDYLCIEEEKENMPMPSISDKIKGNHKLCIHATTKYIDQLNSSTFNKSILTQCIQDIFLTIYGFNKHIEYMHYISLFELVLLFQREFNKRQLTHSKGRFEFAWKLPKNTFLKQYQHM